MRAIYVEITATRGSAPRDAGTAMKVTDAAISGTIGGGALEYEAIRIARDLLGEAGQDVFRTFPLGPGLGQCCGGSVTLRFTREVCDVDAERTPTEPDVPVSAPRGALWLWGAGHVGRAVVRAMPASAYDVTWIDSAATRFPRDVPRHVMPVVASDMARMAAHAPGEAHHLIFTYSHDIDLAICAALLRGEAASIGLIGSDTKRARFFRRLRDMGLDPSRIRCPIGDKTLGKHPDMIAAGVVAELLTTACAA